MFPRYILPLKVSIPQLISRVSGVKRTISVHIAIIPWTCIKTITYCASLYCNNVANFAQQIKADFAVQLESHLTNIITLPGVGPLHFPLHKTDIKCDRRTWYLQLNVHKFAVDIRKCYTLICTWSVMYMHL